MAELDAAVAELGAQKRVLVAGLRARERALGDRCAAAEARAEEAGMLRRAAEARARELEEDAVRREAAQADGEIRLQRLRAEKKVLLAEIRRGAGGGGSGSMVGGGIGGRDRGSEAVGDDGFGDSGSESAGGAVGVDLGRKGVQSPRGSGESVLDRKVGGIFFVVVLGWLAGFYMCVRIWASGRNGLVYPAARGYRILVIVFVIVSTSGLLSVRIFKYALFNQATLKQLSRQLVHLRERQHHLREDLQADPTNLR